MTKLLLVSFIMVNLLLFYGGFNIFKSNILSIDAVRTRNPPDHTP